MSETVLSTHGLSKKYGFSSAVSDVSMTLEAGQIYGLVGRNGAGKTTLMRLVCGQSLPTSGTLELFGRTAPDLTEARTRIGCMIDTPAFYPNLSAKKNLKIYCMRKGLPVTRHIDEMLSFVGLEDAGNKEFFQFSLGMKERLGLAFALMGSPDLLVLDEPIKGLDPLGVSRIRELVVKLNKERGTTVLISSNILKELASVATCYGFIDKGRLIEEVSTKELHARCKDWVTVEVDNIEKACAVLENICGCEDYKVFPDNTIRCYDRAVRAEQVNRALSENGVCVYSITSGGKI